MFSHLPPLTSLRAFEAAVRLGAFNLAAEELNVTPAAVGAQIQTLEAWLGYELFERRNRRVIPKENALRLQQAIHNGFAAIRDGLAVEVTGRNTLTVGVGSLFASRWLSPRLSEFWNMHPEVSLRLVHSPVITNSLATEFDVAIIWGSGFWPNVIAQTILRPSLTPVASPAYLSKYGHPTRPQDLKGHLLIQEKDFGLWRAWFEAVGCQTDYAAAVRSAGDGAVAMQLALDGQGICIGVSEFLENDILQGRLAAPFDPVIIPGFAYHLVHRPLREGHSATRKFINWISSSSY